MMGEGIAWACLGVALFGFCASTWLFPVVSWLRQSFKKPEPEIPSPPWPSAFKIDVFVFCRAEDKDFSLTLMSLNAATLRLERYYPGAKVRAVMVAQGCPDATLSRVKGMGCEVQEFPRGAARWTVLDGLLREVTSHWTVCVRAGAVWSDDLLIKAISFFKRGRVSAVLPAHRFRKISPPRRFKLWFEARLRSLESRTGSPTSQENGIFIYRTGVLKETLAAMNPYQFLGEEHVLPLMAKKIHPEFELIFTDQLSVLSEAPPRLSAWREEKRKITERIQLVRRLADFTRAGSAARVNLGRLLFQTLWAWWLLLALSSLVIHLYPSLFSLLVFALGVGVLADFLRTAEGRKRLYPLFVSLWAPLAFAAPLMKFERSGK